MISICRICTPHFADVKLEFSYCLIPCCTRTYRHGVTGTYHYHGMYQFAQSCHGPGVLQDSRCEPGPDHILVSLPVRGFVSIQPTRHKRDGTRSDSDPGRAVESGLQPTRDGRAGPSRFRPGKNRSSRVTRRARRQPVPKAYRKCCVTKLSAK